MLKEVYLTLLGVAGAVVTLFTVAVSIADSNGGAWLIQDFIATGSDVVSYHATLIYCELWP